MEKQIVLWEDIDSMIESIKPFMEKEKFDYVAGIRRGGLIPAMIISHKYDIKCIEINDFVASDMKLLVVDDIVDSGKTIKNAKIKLDRAIYKYKSLSLYVKTSKEHFVDCYVRHALEDKWYQFPWESEKSTQTDEQEKKYGTITNVKWNVIKQLEYEPEPQYCLPLTGLKMDDKGKVSNVKLMLGDEVVGGTDENGDMLEPDDLTTKHISKEREIAKHIHDIIELIGDDPKREGLKDTPRRVSETFIGEIYKGYNYTEYPSLKTFKNIDYDQMIFDSGNFTSICEHHMLPFSGKYYFAYIPNKKLIGLSKISRLVEYTSAKLQMQERIGHDVVSLFCANVDPLGVGIVLEGEHFCKSHRGTKNKGKMITSSLKGVFLKKDSARNEFFKLIDIAKS